MESGADARESKGTLRRFLPLIATQQSGHGAKGIVQKVCCHGLREKSVRKLSETRTLNEQSGTDGLSEEN